MTSLHLKILHELYNETNSFYQSYKKEQDKILYFAGTVFISVITITGIYGAIGQENIVYNFRWYHLLIFHTIFFILYLFYSYKMLCAQIYLIIGIEIESAIQKILKLSSHQTIHLTQLKHKFLGDSLRVKALKKGLNPGKLANILIILLYSLTSLGPYIILQAFLSKENQTTLKIDSNIWTLLITIAFFIVFAIVDRRLNARRKRITHQVAAEMKNKLNDFNSVTISLDKE
jgi:hypothetical protein